MVVFVINLVVMSGGAFLAYQQSPDRPDQFVGPDGDVVTTDEQITEGKAVFQRNGLMNQGSILGNGAYFDADYTADALDRVTRHMREYVARERYGTGYAELDRSERAVVDDAVERQIEDGGLGDEDEPDREPRDD